MQYRSGDLLSRIVSDVRRWKLLRAGGFPLLGGSFDRGRDDGLSIAGMLPSLPGLSCFHAPARPGNSAAGLVLSRRLGAQLISRRAALQARLVDGIQGLADLLAFGALQIMRSACARWKSLRGYPAAPGSPDRAFQRATVLLT